MPRATDNESALLIQPFPQNPRKRAFRWCVIVSVCVCVCVCVGEAEQAEKAEKDMAEKDKAEKDMAEKAEKEVAFSAVLEHRFINSGSNWQDVKYSRVTLNDGGGYNLNTGEFTAPVAGVYLVSSTYRVIIRYDGSMYTLWRLVKRPAYKSGVPDQDIVMASSNTYSSLAGGIKGPGYFPNTMAVPVQLNRGDRVVVQLAAGGRVYGMPGSTFSAVLWVE